MAKSVAAGKRHKQPWKPKANKAKRPTKGVSPWRVVIVLAIAIAGAIWIGHFAQDVFNEGVDEVAGVRKKPDFPPHPASGPISIQ